MAPIQSTYRRAALCGLVFVASVQMAAPPASAQEGPILNAGSGKVVKDSYIVVLKDPAPDAGVDAKASTVAARHGATVRRIYRAALRGFSATMSELRARRMAADPDVAYVEQDTLMHAATDQSSPPAWGLDRIDERHLPTDDNFNYDVTASNVNAYILDTGIRITHDKFGGRARHGRDLVNDDNDASDCHGHGTHVAGTVGAPRFGVAKRVTLIASRS